MNVAEEKQHVASLAKAMPTDTPFSIKRAFKIAYIRLEFAWQKETATEHLVAEMEQLAGRAVALDEKKKRAAQRPIANTEAAAPDVDPPITPIDSGASEPAPTPPEPAPCSVEKETIIPDSFADWTLIPIATKSEVSIGAPTPFTAAKESFSGMAYDRYLLDAAERFERTPFLIDGLLIDAGDWAATFDVLDFLKSFGGRYAPFVKNIFLARLKQLTEFEATTRHSVNDFRQIRAQVVTRWTAGLTLFLQGLERGLAGKPELLVHARSKVNQLALARLFNSRTGRINFRATHLADEQEVAESRLVKIFMDETRGKTEAVDLEIMQELRTELKLSPAVGEDLDAHIVKLFRRVSAAPTARRISKDKLAAELAEQLTADPIYALAKRRIRSLTNVTNENAFTLFKWIADLTEKVRLPNLDNATNLLMAEGLEMKHARALAEELTLRPAVLEKRFQTALGQHGRVGATFVANATRELDEIKSPRLRFALSSFTEELIKHFAKNPCRFKHIKDRFVATAVYFRLSDVLLGRFTQHLPLGTSDVRRYVLQSTVAEKVIAKRKNAGVGRFDHTASLFSDVGRDFAACLTAAEKDGVNAAAWFREMFHVSEARWESIVKEYLLPKVPTAPVNVRKAYEVCRDQVIKANIWEIIDNPRAYRFAGMAITSLEQRARQGKIEILHGLAAGGIDVFPFSGEVRTRVAQIFSGVAGAPALPPSVAEALVTEIVRQIVARQVVSRHWPQWIARRTGFLLRADKVIAETGRLDEREKVLLTLITAPANHVRQAVERLASNS